MKLLNKGLMVLLLLPLASCAREEPVKEVSQKPAVVQQQVVSKASPAKPAVEAPAEDAGKQVDAGVEKKAAQVVPVAAPAPTAETAAIYQEGVHYERLPQPVPTRDRNRVEVVEVFWYGCIHCYRFDPEVNNWAKSQPDYVDFKHMPAIWRNEMLLHAQAYYAAEALGVLDVMHDALFKAMNEEKNTLASEDAIAELFVANGVTEADFQKTFNSFGVKSLTMQAKSRIRSYRITGTPEMIVNGKFRLSGRMANGNTEMLKVVDWLVEQEKKEMKSE